MTRRTPLQELALLRLVAQRLVGGGAPTPAQAVGGLLAAQGQDLPGVLTSIALRTAGRSVDEVRAACDAGLLVRSWPMRGTLHVVLPEDLGWLRELTTARLVAGAARRRAALELDERVLERARELALAALAGGGRLSREALYGVWARGGVGTDGQRGYHLLWHIAQTGSVCFGPFDGREQLVVRCDEWIAGSRVWEREAALVELARRYFRGHGPATVKDLARWVGLPLGEVRRGLADAAGDLAQRQVDGVTYYLDPAVVDGLAAHRREAGGVLLLPGFDEFVLGYADRSACLPAEFAERIVPGGNGMFRATVVAGGQVVGVWRREGRGAARAVEATPFTAFTAAIRQGVVRAYDALP
ncbi:hypothetical protein GCM10010124_32740 [Pilimelia terevasa]|uniref:Winged helix DNA-binding domain-containing protein n=1 Tax=Pilimelia terevasa TaxID=53372 RepID=A0A8J3BQX3_9ACTN|nr:winged helix DNA-binding domain-containing protein [Pilimelia terevasa]GGK37408.1 hypothetical protein GCM10010124_32740 [Pilimelia terevasa]